MKIPLKTGQKIAMLEWMTRETALAFRVMMAIDEPPGVVVTITRAELENAIENGGRLRLVRGKRVKEYVVPDQMLAEMRFISGLEYVWPHRWKKGEPRTAKSMDEAFWRAAARIGIDARGMVANDWRA